MVGNLFLKIDLSISSSSLVQNENSLYKVNGTSIGIIGSDLAIGGGSSSDLSIYTYGANNMKFWTNGVNRLTIQTDTSLK